MLFGEAALVPNAIADAKECRQRPQSMFEKAGADAADTIRSCWGAAQHGVGRWSVQCFDLEIYERLTVFYDHVTVDTVQARVATMVTLEVYKFSAVADQEKLKIILGCVCVYRLEVKTFLNDVTLRPAIDRFVFFVHAVGVKKKGQPATTTNHHGPTAFKHLIEEAMSQSYAKTPKLEHIRQLEVFAHWIPEALQAGAEDVVKSFRAEMGSHVGAQKRAPSASQQDANEKT